jgi:MFS family permease
MQERQTSASRLFAGSCTAIVALAFSFAAMSGVMFDLKREFLLDNAQVGLIGGAGLWGMALSQIGFSSLCDAFGMRNLLRIAMLGQAAGVALFILANGFALLFAGALVMAIANGMIEAVCNPLVATLFPDRKAAMLNRLHLWFPGGIVLGGLAVYGLDVIEAGWRAKMLIVLVPVAGYALLLARAKFPPTEAAQHGRRLRDAFHAVATTPLLWLFLALMAVTMSLELGPGRWIPAVLEAGGMHGILVLVLINGVMALMRTNAHAILGRVPPPMLLALCTGIAGIGLYWLSYASGVAETVAAALVFAIGISVVWPTMMGFVAERAPRTGALGLGLMAAAGSFAVGLVTTPLLGQIADSHIAQAVPVEQLQALQARAPQLPQETGAFLRHAADGEAGPEIAAQAQPILSAAENRSGLLSFRYLLPFAALVCLIFAIIAFIDRRRGGYAAQVARVQLGASQ